jgi:hypothetical protein
MRESSSQKPQMLKNKSLLCELNRNNKKKNKTVNLQTGKGKKKKKTKEYNFQEGRVAGYWELFINLEFLGLNWNRMRKKKREKKKKNQKLKQSRT